jgi:hypothetical protein
MIDNRADPLRGCGLFVGFGVGVAGVRRSMGVATPHAAPWWKPSTAEGPARRPSSPHTAPTSTACASEPPPPSFDNIVQSAPPVTSPLTHVCFYKDDYKVAVVVVCHLVSPGACLLLPRRGALCAARSGRLLGILCACGRGKETVGETRGGGFCRPLLPSDPSPTQRKTFLVLVHGGGR